MSVTAVQFYGIDRVVEAYTNKGTPAFAVWCGKQLLFRYDGTDSNGEDDEPTLQIGEQLLRSCLEAMWSGTTATYTLKTYDELKKGQKIRPSTEYDTAFNFKICEPVQTLNGPMYPGQAAYNEIKQLRAEVEAMKAGPGDDDDDDDDDDEPETLQEAVIGLLKEPERLQQIVEPLRELVSIGKMLLGGEPLEPTHTLFAHRSPAAVTGVKKIGAVDKDELLVRLGIAINTLEAHDKDLVTHLEKLAAVAQKEPDKFKGLLAMLDML